MPKTPIQKFLQQAEDTYACYEVLFGSEPTEEEIVEARVRHFAEVCV